MKVIFGVSLIIALTITCFCFNALRAETVPAAAYAAGNAFLDVLKLHLQEETSFQKGVFKTLNVNSSDEFSRATICDPYSCYRMTHNDLEYLESDAARFLLGATFTYYSFPLLIDEVPHGVIDVELNDSGWQGIGFKGEEPIFDFLFTLSKENRAQSGNSFSLVILDTRVLFAFIRVKAGDYLVPFNENSADELSLKDFSKTDFPRIPFSKAIGSLKEYSLKNDQRIDR